MNAHDVLHALNRRGIDSAFVLFEEIGHNGYALWLSLDEDEYATIGPFYADGEPILESVDTPWLDPKYDVNLDIVAFFNPNEVVDAYFELKAARSGVDK